MRLFSPILYLCSHLSMTSWTHGFLLYVVSYNPVLLYFGAQSSPALAIGSYFIWSLYLLRPYLCDFQYLFSGTTRCFKLHLYTFCPSPRISHFSKESRFLLLENSIGSQNLETWYARCYLGIITSRSSQLTEKRNICVYTNTRVYLYLCIFLYVATYIYLLS